MNKAHSLGTDTSARAIIGPCIFPNAREHIDYISGRAYVCSISANCTGEFFVIIIPFLVYLYGHINFFFKVRTLKYLWVIT